MTRQHYITIAEAIAIEVDHSVHTHEPTDMLECLVNRLCQVFKEDNPRFDAKRFKAAAIQPTTSA